jgi:transposase
VYTEHRFPLGTNFDVKSSVIYGKNLKSLSVLLSNEGIIAQKRLSDFFSEVSDGLIKLSDATIKSFNSVVSEKIDVDTLTTELLNGEVMHVDDTSLRCVQKLDIDEEGLEKIKTAKNSTFNVVVRTYSNDKTTLYTVNPKKDDKGVKKDDILTKFCGILSHDHERKFYKYGGFHATCGAHLSRELKGLSELYHIPWAEIFRSFYLELNDYKKATKCCDPKKLSEFELRYNELVDSGNADLEKMKPQFVDDKSKTKSKFGFKKFKAMLKRLTKYKDNYLLFLKNYAAPFTNNLAERDLRPCNTKQKVSGCFRTWEGLNCFARIRSLISTAKKNSLNVLEIIRALVKVEFVSEG